jgi:hypothetical protein
MLLIAIADAAFAMILPPLSSFYAAAIFIVTSVFAFFAFDFQYFFRHFSTLILRH